MTDTIEWKPEHDGHRPKYWQDGMVWDMNEQLANAKRYDFHKQLNRLVQPDCGFIPLRETCELLLEYERPLIAEIAALKAEIESLKNA